MPHNCCVPLCKKKGYRAVTIDGKEVKVTYHNFPSESSTSRSKLRMQWICAIRQDVVRTSDQAGGRRYVCCTSEKRTSTTSTVATELSEKILPWPSFFSTVPLAGGKWNQHEAVAPAGVDHAVAQLPPPARHW